MQVTRQYHSTALLLPDGRVLSAGGGICGTCDSVGLPGEERRGVLPALPVQEGRVRRARPTSPDQLRPRPGDLQRAVRNLNAGRGLHQQGGARPAGCGHALGEHGATLHTALVHRQRRISQRHRPGQLQRRATGRLHALRDRRGRRALGGEDGAGCHITHDPVVTSVYSGRRCDRRFSQFVDAGRLQQGHGQGLRRGRLLAEANQRRGAR